MPYLISLLLGLLTWNCTAQPTPQQHTAPSTPSDTLPPPPGMPPPDRPLAGMSRSETGDPADQVYRVVEEMPAYGSCHTLSDQGERRACSETAVVAFLAQHIDYPYPAPADYDGTAAVVQFIVEKDGSLSNLSLIRDPGAGLGAEALRLLQLLASEGEAWAPGKQNGQPQRVQFILPIRPSLD
ncbi:MAG: energy transducer TonB [Bacteroidota bacterium]